MLKVDFSEVLMNLSQIDTHKIHLTLNVVATDSELATEIHSSLVELEYLEDECCKLFDKCLCALALWEFQMANKLTTGVVDSRTAKALISLTSTNSDKSISAVSEFVADY